MNHQALKKWLNVFFLLVMPALLVVTAYALKQARGPYWMGSNYDPDYAYLLNSLNLAKGHGIGHYDHPGTPVQIIGAIIIRLAYFTKTFNFAGLEENVIAHPEFYLQTISWTLVAINAWLVLMIGWTSFRLTRNYYLTFLIQSAPLFSAVVLNNSLTKVSAEPLLLTASLGFIWLSLLYIGSKDSPNNHRFGIGYGLMAGLGLATKINFLPLTVAPLLILPGLKTKIIYIISTVLAFIFFTLPIVPIYPAFFSWIYRLSSHASIHGTGQVAIFNFSSLLANLKILAHQFQTLTLILTLVVGLIVYLGYLVIWPNNQRLRQLVKSLEARLVIGLVISQLVGIIMVGKHLGGHYLIPVIVLFGLLIFSIDRLIDQINRPLAVWPRLLKWLLVILVLRLYAQTFTSIQELRQTMADETHRLAKIDQKIQTEFQDFAKIYYFRSSSAASALKFGDDLALGLHAPTLKKIYPDVFYYNIWERQLYAWNDPVKISDIQAVFGQKIVLAGTSFAKHYQAEPGYKPNWPLVDILDGDPETIYRLGN